MNQTTPKKWHDWLADPAIFFYACLWLVVLVIAGTLAQPGIGLYKAQEIYFSSWFFPMGPVPLPGGRLTMAVIFVNLVIYLIFNASPKKNIGLYITHLGTLLLLLGGFLTAYFSSEGTMVIQEGGSSDYVSDYHAREFVIITPGSDEDKVTAFGMGWLKAGSILKHESIPGEIEILEAYTNCEARRRDAMDPSFKGLGSQYTIRPIPDNPQDEQNMYGFVAAFRGFGPNADGNYVFVEYQNDPTQVADKICVLRKKRTYVPFQIELIDFEKKLHPGTQMPKSYKSVVNLIEEGQKRRVVIQMNEPLRHKGYTFFQSSFIEGQGGGKDSTVLAAVKNYGRQFPYISSIIMSIGLLIYLMILVPRRRRVMQSKEG